MEFEETGSKSKKKGKKQ